MAKIENFQLIAKPGEMTRGVIACKANYKSEDERVLNETSGQLESPIGKGSWREEDEHEFFSKTSICETETAGKKVNYTPVSISHGVEPINFILTLKYKYRTNSWDWHEEESTHEEYYYEDEEGNWTVDTPQSTPTNEQGIYGKDYVIYNFFEMESETVTEKVPVLDKDGNHVKDEETGDLKYEEVTYERGVKDIYDVVFYTAYIKEEKWKQAQTSVTDSFYPSPETFTFIPSGTLEMGLVGPQQTSISGRGKTLSELLPLKDFVIAAGQWKSWYNQSYSPCEEWGTGRLSASKLNSMYSFFNQVGGYSSGDKVVLSMFTNLFNYINQ